MTRRKPKTFEETFQEGKPLLAEISRSYNNGGISAKELEDVLKRAKSYSKYSRKTWLGKRRLDQEKKNALDELLFKIDVTCDKVEARINSMELFARISSSANPEPRKGIATRDLRKSRINPSRPPKRLLQHLLALD